MSYHLHLKADIQDQNNMSKMETIKQTHKHKSVQNSNPKKTQMQTPTITQTQRQRQTHSNVKINSCDSLPHKHTSKLK